MNGKSFFGTILIIAGGLFLLDSLNLLSFGNVIGTWWPLIIIFIGLYRMSTDRTSKTPGGILLIIGIVLQITRFDFLNIDTGKILFPAILITIGAGLLASHRKAINSFNSEDSITGFAAFSGANIGSVSSSFKGGSVTAFMGGAEVDLRGADIEPIEPARLNITAIFGGIDIFVPPHWQIRCSGIPLFGGWSNKTSNRNNINQGGPILYVNCLVAFGGMDIKN